MSRRQLFTAAFVFFLSVSGNPVGATISAPSPAVRPPMLTEESSDAMQEESTIQQWCGDVRGAVKTLGWKIEPCREIQWKVGRLSVKGRPLVYAEFGSPQAANVTLILSTIHGDEVTPLYLGIELANWVRDHQDELGNSRVVIAPLVNPDSFFAFPRTRVNARGVDVNRNFLTSDWHARALNAWKRKFNSNKRRFPGFAPRSEPETIFQEELIQRYRPQKILAVHAPLNFMDYDGPTHLALERFPFEYVDQCMKLRKQFKAVSGGFFPGSLGNYAGRELGIPTLTLELPSANARKARQYWQQFSTGIRTMIHFQVPDYAVRRLENSGG